MGFIKSIKIMSWSLTIIGKPYNRGVRFILRREDFEPSITQTERKIEKVYEFIKLCVSGQYKPEDVNEWWNLQGAQND